MSRDELSFSALGVSASLANALRLGLAVDHKNRPQAMKEFQGLLLGCIASIATAQTPGNTHTDLPDVTEDSEALKFFADHRFKVEMPTSPIRSESIKLNAHGEIVAFIPETQTKVKSTISNHWFWAIVVIFFVIVWATTEKDTPTPTASEVARSQQQHAELDAWNTAKAQNTGESYAAFLTNYPLGYYAELARIAQQKLQSEAAQRKMEQADEREREARDAERLNTEAAYRQYQTDFPQGLHSNQVDSRLRHLVADAAMRAEADQWSQAQSASDSATLQAFLNRYPDGRYTVQAQTLLADLKKKEAEPYSTVGNYPIADCVKDKRTRLTWEGKTVNGERASSNTYTNFGDRRSGDASAYVHSVNAMRLCGYDDWRLPTIDELKGLVVKESQPMINGTWLPNTQARFYWSASPYKDYAPAAWVVSFGNGDVLSGGRGSALQVRLVR
jgi:hypothetical protein